MQYILKLTTEVSFLIVYLIVSFRTEWNGERNRLKVITPIRWLIKTNTMIDV
jgi:hypothetical protein